MTDILTNPNLTEALPSTAWKFTTPDEPGFHTIITPENSNCRAVWFFRLNLPRKQAYTLQNDSLELSATIIAGQIDLTVAGQQETLVQFSSFYLPGATAAEIVAAEDTILYIGGALYEGIGEFFTRAYDPAMPIGEIRQIHGAPPYEREVFMTVNQEVPASRLITGLTWGDDGRWTSWPPHQHEKDLEEIYCYFDIPAPKFALHLSYTKPGVIETVHPVSSGDCVIIPKGYHPTVAIPGIKSSYFWVMAAHSHQSRSYELAVSDPNFLE